MNILNEIYQEVPKKFTILDRKINLSSSKLILFGPPKCGKTSLLLKTLFLHKKERSLYIDCNDLRIQEIPTDEEINLFIAQKQIDFVAIDHSLRVFDLPNAKEVYIACKKPLFSTGFQNSYLLPLDFEEYLSFQQKQIFNKQNSDDNEDGLAPIFSHFIKDGALPQTQTIYEHSRTSYAQDMLRQLIPAFSKQRIFLFFVSYLANRLTLLQAFSIVKDSIKISKDQFYLIVEELLLQQFLFAVPQYNLKMPPKKYYIFDFSLKNALSFKKDFGKVFENMVYLQLLSLQEPIFFTTDFHFFLPKSGRTIICSPFIDEESAKTKIGKIVKKNLEHTINQIEIVTANPQFNFEINNILVEAQPFWEWAIKE